MTAEASFVLSFRSRQWQRLPMLPIGVLVCAFIFAALSAYQTLAAFHFLQASLLVVEHRYNKKNVLTDLVNIEVRTVRSQCPLSTSVSCRKQKVCIFSGHSVSKLCGTPPSLKRAMHRVCMMSKPCT